MELSNDQKKSFELLYKWCLKDSKYPFITLGGYAGTGKTTLIALLAKELKRQNPELKIAFCAYTGKAARVLSSKLTNANFLVSKKDFVGTIHALLYQPIHNLSGDIIGWEPKKTKSYDLLIIDEASMVSESIWNDLLSLKTKILAVGDHGQLPPLEGNFNLMKNPMLKLLEIHRQAKENPIIQMSIEARTLGYIKPKQHLPNVVKYKKTSSEVGDVIEEEFRSLQQDDTYILCGYNNTRIKINQQIRSYKEFESPYPESGDKLVCLRNNHKKQIFNGMLGTVKKSFEIGDGTIRLIPAEEKVFHINLEMPFEDFIYSGEVSSFGFNAAVVDRKTKLDLFDYGYALTVHKSQGSQARKVILFEERFAKMDDESWKRWLYTAVTRAEEDLIIIGD